MRTLRRYLALPFWAFAMLLAVTGLAMHKTGNGLHRLARVWKDHVYIVAIWVYRWVKGVPTWQQNDLMMGWQPRTKAQIAYAKTLPGIALAKCDCGSPDCVFGKQEMFVPRLAYDEAQRMVARMRGVEGKDGE